MVAKNIVRSVRRFLAAAVAEGIHVESALVYGSQATGRATPESDIDLAVIAPEFDRGDRRRWVRKLWKLRTATDSRIEPLAVGLAGWNADQGSPMIEIVRREGIRIPLPR